MFNIHHLLGGAMCIGQREGFPKAWNSSGPWNCWSCSLRALKWCQPRSHVKQLPFSPRKNRLLANSLLHIHQGPHPQRNRVSPSSRKKSIFSFFCFNLNVSNIFSEKLFILLTDLKSSCRAFKGMQRYESCSLPKMDRVFPVECRDLSKAWILEQEPNLWIDFCPRKNVGWKRPLEVIW